MNTTPLMIAILGTGISLAGLIIGLIVWLRADMKDLREDMKDLRSDMKGMESGLRTDMKHMEAGLQTQIKDLRTDTKDMEVRLSAVEHSQAKLEGLMQGLREAIVARSKS